MNNIDYGKKITDEYRKQTIDYGRKTFDLKDDIVYQISMMSYDKYNDKIATMYDNTDVYSYSEIEDEERAELEYALQESFRAIEYLQLLLTLTIGSLKNILTYGDEWHWDNATIRDYIEDVLRELQGDDYND